MANDRYMARYWHGGKDRDRIRELCEELTSILGGVTYTQSCKTSAGKQYKKLVFEYEVTTNN